MHCIKTINIERDVGQTRFFLLASLTFFVIFCLSYISTSFHYASFYKATYLPLFLMSLLLLYPIHKLFHIILFILFRKPIQIKLALNFLFFPVLHVFVLQMVSKRLYSWALILPFLTLNSFFLCAAFIWPMFAHYFSLLLALHCSICLLDLLFIKQMIRTPKNSYIEETSRGYEILVQDTTN